MTEVRTPTNTWSGLGFSKSMPAETIKELRRANHVSYKPTMTTAYEVHLFPEQLASSCPWLFMVIGTDWLGSLSIFVNSFKMDILLRCRLFSPFQAVNLYVRWTFKFGSKFLLDGGYPT